MFTKNKPDHANPASLPAFSRVQELQRQRAEKRRILETVRQSLEQQEITISAAEHIDASRLEELRAEKEVMLAEIAIGGGDQATLETLETQLDEEAQRVAHARSGAKQAAGKANETKNGLEKKRAQVEGEIADLDQAHAEQLAELVREMANLKIARYLALAGELSEAVAELSAIARLGYQFGHDTPAHKASQSIMWRAFDPYFQLPQLHDRFPAMSEFTAPEWWGGNWRDSANMHIFSVQHFLPRRADELNQAMTAELRGLGIEF